VYAEVAVDLAVWRAEDQKPQPPPEEEELAVVVFGSDEVVVEVGSFKGVPARERVCSMDFLVVVGAGKIEPIVADWFEGVAGRAMEGVEVVVGV
jgi:hypothetical protein